MNKKDKFQESEGSRNWEQRDRERKKKKYRQKNNRREKDDRDFLEQYGDMEKAYQEE